MSKGERRREFIFEQLGQGVPSNEILDILDERKTQGIVAERRGNESEERTASIIETIEVVKKVRHFPKDSAQDRQKRDLQVDLLQNEMRKLVGQEPSIGHAWIQVKSNGWSVDKFRRKYGRTKEIRDKNLARVRLIVVDGMGDVDNLKESFIKQITYINSYWHRIKQFNTNS